MAYREFEDAAGRLWRVWDVYPTRAERRLGAERRGADRSGEERRRWDETRVLVPPALLDGWLCFETGGERRRLAPVPSGWDGAPDAQLLAWLSDATLAPVRRLAE